MAAPSTTPSAPSPESDATCSPGADTMRAPVAWRRIACAIGCCDRCSTEAASATIACGVMPFSATTSTTSGTPRVSVPVLSKATQRTVPVALEVGAALDQHAFARRAGERGDDRHRRRDDERARTRHDEQHERAVDPRRASSAPATSGGAIATTTDKREHQRRVDAREPLDHRLRRRALGLRALDQVNDARERRVAPPARDAHVERAASVDRPGKHLVARRLVGRQRLAGHRRLVDAARAGDDRAVERNLLAGTNDDHRADRHLVHADAPFAGIVHQQRVDRREIEQAADRGSARARASAPRASARRRTERRRRPLPTTGRARWRRRPRPASAR